MIALERHLVSFGAPVGPASTVVASLRRDADGLHYRLVLSVPGLVLPVRPDGPPARRDGLWRRTCAELFVAERGRPGYLEWNLSPSGHWNLYRFDGYREGGREAALEPPPAHFTVPAEPGVAIEGFLPLAPFGLEAALLELAACAVVETDGGRLSWWAPCHAGERPDFHDRRGFTLLLPTPSATGDT